MLWLSRAAELGHVRAQYELGDILITHRNYDAGILLLLKASVHNNKDAIRRLQKIIDSPALFKKFVLCLQVYKVNDFSSELVFNDARARAISNCTQIKDFYVDSNLL